MNMQDQKISGSRNWAVWGLDFLERYQPDALRFYLTINMPETRDANWDWDDFVTRNNSQLVANWGNLANRVLSFGHKHWEGVIPIPGEFTEEDKKVLGLVEDGFKRVGDLLDGVKLRAALQEALAVATEVNKYLDETAPWSAVKIDKERAGTIIYVAMQCIDHLKTIFSPFLPHSSELLHGFLGYSEPLFGKQVTQEVEDGISTHTTLEYKPENASGKWAPVILEPGKAFNQPKPLFQKLDPHVAEEERERLGEE